MKIGYTTINIGNHMYVNEYLGEYTPNLKEAYVSESYESAYNHKLSNERIVPVELNEEGIAIRVL